MWQLAGVALGVALLALMLRRVGVEEVRRGFESLGPWFLAVLALGGVRFAARTRSWLVCMEGSGTTFRFADAFATVLSADALGNLTPLGVAASEPAKVMLARSRVPTVIGVSSVAIDNFCYMVSVVLVISAGTVVFLQRSVVPDPWRHVGLAAVSAAALALTVGAWAARRRPAVLTSIAGVAARLGRSAHVPAERLAEVEERVYAPLAWPVGRWLRVAGWQGLFHAAAVVEVYLVLRLLPGAAAAGVIDAFLLESAGRLIVVAFKFVPYRLGVDEAGSALVAQALALDPTVGVTLALVRKLRILCWNAVGIALLARSSASRLKP